MPPFIRCESDVNDLISGGKSELIFFSGDIVVLNGVFTGLISDLGNENES